MRKLITFSLFAVFYSMSVFAISAGINYGDCLLPKSVIVDGKEYMAPVIPISQKPDGSGKQGIVKMQIPFLVHNIEQGRVLLNAVVGDNGILLGRQYLVGWADPSRFDVIDPGLCRTNLQLPFLKPYEQSASVKPQAIKPKQQTGGSPALFAKMAKGGCVEAQASGEQPVAVFQFPDSGDQIGEITDTTVFNITDVKGSWMQIAIARGVGEKPKPGAGKKIGWVQKQYFGIVEYHNCGDE